MEFAEEFLVINVGRYLGLMNNGSRKISRFFKDTSMISRNNENNVLGSLALPIKR